MLDLPIITILAPFVAGAVALAIPNRLKALHEFISAVTSIGVFVLAYSCFRKTPLVWMFGQNAILRIDALAAFVGLFIGLFGMAVTIYSIGFMKGRAKLNQYYAFLLWTLGGSLGAAFSNNLIVLLGFWGFLGLTLYLLISMGGPESAYAAKKTFIIIGGSDAVMLFGIAIIWHLLGTFNMDAVRLDLNNNILASLAFLCLAIGAFAKAGAMPLHTWIPDSSEVAPAPVMAFLPASLDKLLGIYLLARISLDMFIVKANSGMSILLLIVGSVTIIAAVMMALVQHNLKKLLAYHAVSQVGYMVLGIGTANPIGIAGGLFHMVNHAVYKSCLFLSGGSVEKEAGTAELDRLGGLAHIMPITFATCLIASLSISGVPPFNGFFSKWMVYQGLIELGKNGAKSWVIWLIVAMFGSALTLASFMKLIYSTFLAPRTTPFDSAPLASPGTSRGRRTTNIGEAPLMMWLPQVALAALCVIFGIFAYQIPIKLFIVPSLKGALPSPYPGIWNAPLAAILILAGLALGFLLFIIGKAMPIRRSGIFAGGESLDDDSGIKGTAFYNTIKDIPFLGRMYALADKKVFDIYEGGGKVTFFFTNILQWLHNGVLPTYMAWCLIGMLVLFLALVR